MKKLFFLVIIFIASLFQSYAQVKDVSFTLSPGVSYNWWDKYSGLDQSFMYGARVGFGFGEYVELRATYLKSYDLKTRFDNFGLPNYNAALFNPQDVDINRWGGELKTNIGTGRFSPFITLGTGVQTIKLNEDKTEQIYASGGAGIKLKIGNRATFTVEAKNTTYTHNAVAYLLSDQNKADFGVNEANYNSRRLYNWSVLSSMQFYLGGRKPGELTELDKAYMQNFKNGFRGVRWVIEPELTYVDFNSSSLFRDAYFVGGYAGLDFNEYIGIRGFYFKASNNEKVSTDFDDLDMFGSELKAKLNISRGVTPFLSLGAGYLSPGKDYRGVDNKVVSGEYFASTGIGLSIPLSKYVEFYGSAKYMFMSGSNVTDIATPDQIISNKMYSAGLKFSLGKRAQKPEDILERERNTLIQEQKTEYDKALNELKTEYENKIAELEAEIQATAATGDTAKAIEILEQRNEAEQQLEKLNKLEKPAVVVAEQPAVDSTVKPLELPENEVEEKAVVEKEVQEKTVAGKPADSTQNVVLIRMTPEQLEKIIKTIFEGVKELRPAVQTESKTVKDTTSVDSAQLKSISDRLERLENSLTELNQMQSNRLNPAVSDESDAIIEKLDKMQLALFKLSLEVSNLKENRNPGVQPIIINPGANEGEQVVMVPTERKKSENKMKLSAVAPIMGVNMGTQGTFNIGARAYFPIKSSAFEFVPEFFYGLASPASFGLSGNVIVPFTLKSGFKPYVGAGLGIFDIDDKTNPGFNIIAGTYFNFMNGKVFGDISARNLKNYQLAVGYRIDF